MTVTKRENLMTKVHTTLDQIAKEPSVLSIRILAKHASLDTPLGWMPIDPLGGVSLEVDMPYDLPAENLLKACRTVLNKLSLVPVDNRGDLEEEVADSNDILQAMIDDAVALSGNTYKGTSAMVTLEWRIDPKYATLPRVVTLSKEGIAMTGIDPNVRLTRADAFTDSCLCGEGETPYTATSIFTENTLEVVFLKEEHINQLCLDAEVGLK